jgi:hypothetical protein
VCGCNLNSIILTIGSGFVARVASDRWIGSKYLIVRILAMKNEAGLLPFFILFLFNLLTAPASQDKHTDRVLRLSKCN